MHKKLLIKQLQTLKNNVRPNAEWQASYRSVLLAQISAQTSGVAPVTPREKVIAYLKPFSILMRPMGALLFTIIVGFGAWIASVNATRNSLPGDILYPLKLTAERVQVNLASNKTQKTTLEIAFAERRLKELTAVTHDASKKGKESASVPLQKFKENLASVKNNLEQIKLENPQKAAELAELVDKKTEEYVSILQDNKTAGGEQKAEVKDAIAKSKVTNDAAVTVIIAEATASQQTQPYETLDRLLNRITDKIINAQERSDALKARIEELKKQGIAAIPDVHTATDDTPDTQKTEQKQIAVTELLARIDQVNSDLKEASFKLTQQQADVAFDTLKKADDSMDELEALLDALDQPQEDKAQDSTAKTQEESAVKPDDAKPVTPAATEEKK